MGADGSVTDEAGAVVNDQTAVAACALGPGPELELALDHIETLRGVYVASTTNIPHTPDVLGWPWTDGGFGWVEPTSWAVLAIAHTGLPRLRSATASRSFATGSAAVEGGTTGTRRPSGWSFRRSHRRPR